MAIDIVVVETYFEFITWTSPDHVLKQFCDFMGGSPTVHHFNKKDILQNNLGSKRSLLNLNSILQKKKFYKKILPKLRPES